MEWNKLTTKTDLDTLDKVSEARPAMIFKHSTRCSISSAALNRVERGWNSNLNVVPYFLDLLSYRELSHAVAERYGIEHQSPQVLLIKNGRCIYNASHFDIQIRELESITGE